MYYNEEEIIRLEKLAHEWLAIDVNEETRREVQNLVKDKEYLTLDEKLSNRITFGTAGLRSRMCAGFAYMNDVTVLQAAQGLVQYIVDISDDKECSIVVGYDHRFNSQRYAELTANVAISKNVKVYYLGSISNLSDESLKSSKVNFKSKNESNRKYIHTPMVPFAVDYYKASAGVMVTSSHNPSSDNGYKVYYSNGCQIIPPHDRGISNLIESNLKPWNKDIWDAPLYFTKGIENGILNECNELITSSYINAVENLRSFEPTSPFEFVYTPMHGVGLEIFNKIIAKNKNYKMNVVKEQSCPDPKFPTLPFPNPEEKGALDLAIKTADRSGCKMVIANDPDADRFSVAIKSKNQWRQLNGNEIGFLFAMYSIELITDPAKLSKTALLSSTVSSQILSAMAAVHGFMYEDTLTGFKWIGNRAIELKENGYNVPFGFEEAVGYMFGIVNDKDGISAAIMWLQLYEKWFVNSNTDPIDKLREGYEKYGWFKQCNGYYKLSSPTQTNIVFKDIRDSYLGDYPSKIGKYKVLEWRDLTLGYDSSTKDNVPKLPSDPSSQMITVKLCDEIGNKIRFTCRGSGTEPKLKVYIEAIARSESESSKLAQDCWDELKTSWFKPNKYGICEVL